MKKIDRLIVENSTYGAFGSTPFDEEKAKKITEEGQKNIKMIMSSTYGTFSGKFNFNMENTDNL